MEDNKIDIDLGTEVVFKAMTDRMALSVTSDKGTIFEISGYGLEIKLNRDLIHGVEDVEDLLEGIKDMYRKLILADLLDNSQEKN